MPTENRSSNTEAPFRREDRYLVIKYSDLDRLQGLDRHMFLTASRRAHEQMFAAGAHARQFLVIESDWPEFEPTWAAIEARMTGKPAEQHHGKPVAVLYASGDVLTKADCGDAFATCCKVETPLYTHPAPADAGEVEQLRLEIAKLQFDLTMDDDAKIQGDCIRLENTELRSQLAERDALLREFLEVATGGFSDSDHVLRARRHLEAFLSASAEPSAHGNSQAILDGSAERDERAEFEAAWSQRLAKLKIDHRGNEFYRVQPNDLYRWNNVQDGWGMWQARAALECKQSDLVARLQIDLTERDEENDALRESLRLMTGDYRTAIVNGHERITFLGGDCDSVEKMLADNPNYATARALLERKP